LADATSMTGGSMATAGVAGVAAAPGVASKTSLPCFDFCAG